MAHKPKRLLIIGHARAGTTLLTSLLRCNKQTAIVQAEPLDLNRKIENALDTVDTILTPTDVISSDVHFIGCRVTPEQLVHHNLTVEEITNKLGISFIIVVTRNSLIEVMASQRLTQRTGIGYSEAPPSPTANRQKIKILLSDALTFRDENSRLWGQLLAGWPQPSSEIKTIFAPFEKLSIPDIRTEEVHRLWKLLGCDLVDVSTPMIRQHPGDLSEKILNYSELQTIIPQLQHIPVEALLLERWGPTNEVVNQLHEQDLKTHHTEHTKATKLLSVLVASVIFFHCLDSIVKERIFFIEGFSYASLLTLFQCITVTTSACLDYARPTKTHNPSNQSTPWHLYACLGGFLATSTYTANKATMYLNYPTQVIFKSSKLIWTITGSHFILKKRKSMKEWTSGVMIAAGLVFVGRGASSISSDAKGNISAGLAMIVISTIADAGINLLQECMLQDPNVKACKKEVLFFMQMFSLAPALTFFVLSGSVSDSLQFVRDNPIFLLLVLVAGISSFTGTRCIIQIISSYDSSTAVLITSVRKVFTLVLSYMFFPKPWTINHFIGITMVVVGGNFSIVESIRRRAQRQRDANVSFSK